MLITVIKDVHKNFLYLERVVHFSLADAEWNEIARC